MYIISLTEIVFLCVDPASCTMEEVYILFHMRVSMYS